MKTRNLIKDQIGLLSLVLLTGFGIRIGDKSTTFGAVPSVNDAVEMKDQEPLVKAGRGQSTVKKAVQIFNA